MLFMATMKIFHKMLGKQTNFTIYSLISLCLNSVAPISLNSRPMAPQWQIFPVSTQVSYSDVLLVEIHIGVMSFSMFISFLPIFLVLHSI